MGERRDMDRWLGDGGMEIISVLGGHFASYGVDGEDLGWVEGTFHPAAIACNPHGTVQAGVHAVLLDAAMNFAINAALTGRDRTNSTIEIATELMRPARREESYVLRGEVVRLARQVAFAEASVTNAQREILSRATGTFLIHRDAAS